MGTATEYFLNSLATESPCDLIVLVCQKKCNLWLENYCLMNCFILLQLVKVPHDIKNSRLILRCLWFFTEPTKTKTQKSFCTDRNLFLMNIQRTGFNHTEQKKHINPTTFIDTTTDSGVSSRYLSSFQHKSMNNFLFLNCSPSVLCCFSTYFGDRSAQYHQILLQIM